MALSLEQRLQHALNNLPSTKERQNLANVIDWLNILNQDTSELESKQGLTDDEFQMWFDKLEPLKLAAAKHANEHTGMLRLKEAQKLISDHNIQLDLSQQSTVTSEELDMIKTLVERQQKKCVNGGERANLAKIKASIANAKTTPSFPFDISAREGLTDDEYIICMNLLSADTEPPNLMAEAKKLVKEHGLDCDVSSTITQEEFDAMKSKVHEMGQNRLIEALSYLTEVAESLSKKGESSPLIAEQIKVLQTRETITKAELNMIKGSQIERRGRPPSVQSAIKKHGKRSLKDILSNCSVTCIRNIGEKLGVEVTKGKAANISTVVNYLTRDTDQLEAIRHSDLAEICRQNGLAKSGSKTTLISSINALIG